MRPRLASGFLILFAICMEMHVSICGAQEKIYRLPDDHIPKLYTLNLNVNPSTNTLTGNLNIKFVTKYETAHILLHTSPTRINVTKIVLNSIRACNASYSNEDAEILDINCLESLKKGENNILVSYEGLFGRSGVEYEYLGLFKGSYETIQGPKNYVATQFQATFARSAFPCFDEPRFKAEFQITVTHPVDYSVLGNTEILSQSTKNGTVRTTFGKTPLMPTYLIALVVSNLLKTSDNSTKFSINVYSRPSQTKNTGIAIKYGKKLVDALGNWTGIKYEDLGISKLDLVAIPHFASEAMENWGLITFEEHVLLDEGRKTSAEDKQYIISLIAHELAHHWFGNYVTLDWWSNLWLNEGFATYFQYHIPDEVENLDLSRQFITSILHTALEDDDLTGRAMSDSYENINNEDDIVSVFDVISYNKAACVIRMMKSILGYENFQKGLQLYLQTYANNNTNPNNLLECLGKFYKNKTNRFEEIMKNWIYQSGYPIVTASLNKTKNIVTVYQAAFRHIDDTNTTKERLWVVPITFATFGNDNFTVNNMEFLTDRTPLEIPIDNNSWFIMNIQQTGYYRVNYDYELWKRIISVLKSDQMATIHVTNRAQLLDDAFYLAQVGQLEYQIVFELATYLSKEREYEPWYVARKYFKYIRRLLEVNHEDQALRNLKTIVLQWVNSAFPNEENIELSTNLQVLTNQVIYDLKCHMDQETCLKESRKILKKYKMTKVIDDHNTRQTALCFGLRTSETPIEDYNMLLEFYKKSDSPIERRVIISSLGCISDRELLRKYLSELLSNSTIISRPDFRYLIESVYSNNIQGLEVTLCFLEDNLTEILAKYPDLLGLAEIIIKPAAKIVSRSQLNVLKGLLTRYKDVQDLDKFVQTALKLPTVFNNRFEINTKNLNTILKNITISVN